MLCHDTIYYAHPSSFNDPMDSRPFFESDSSNDELRELLALLLRKRMEPEIQMHLHKAGLATNNAKEYAKTQTNREVKKKLSDIANWATDPSEDGTEEEKENWQLKCAVEDELLKQLKGAFCMSTTYSNLLLWSHYGDQHKGICVGYDTNRNPVPQLKKVVYGGKRTIKTSVVCDAYLSENKRAVGQLEKDFLLRKAKDWKYECEWRLIGPEGEQDSTLRLREVIFGIRCEASVRHAIVKALTGRRSEVSYYEMSQRNNGFCLERCEMDTDELGWYLPVTAQSATERGFEALQLLQP